MPSVIGVLDGIGKQVDEDLFKARRISEILDSVSGVDVEAQHVPLVSDRRLHGFDGMGKDRR